MSRGDSKSSCASGSPNALILWDVKTNARVGTCVLELERLYLLQRTLQGTPSLKAHEPISHCHSNTLVRPTST